MLALWHGGRSARMLHRVEDDQADDFKLYAVSRDGKSILYGWRGFINHHFEPRVMRMQYLRL
jgi:hypothetical protein